jgi:hypothetical protein
MRGKHANVKMRKVVDTNFFQCEGIPRRAGAKAKGVTLFESRPALPGGTPGTILVSHRNALSIHTQRVVAFWKYFRDFLRY